MVEVVINTRGLTDSQMTPFAALYLGNRADPRASVKDCGPSPDLTPDSLDTKLQRARIVIPHIEASWRKIASAISANPTVQGLSFPDLNSEIVFRNKGSLDLHLTSQPSVSVSALAIYVAGTCQVYTDQLFDEISQDSSHPLRRSLEEGEAIYKSHESKALFQQVGMKGQIKAGYNTMTRYSFIALSAGFFQVSQREGLITDNITDRVVRSACSFVKRVSALRINELTELDIELSEGKILNYTLSEDRLFIVKEGDRYRHCLNPEIIKAVISRSSANPSNASRTGCPALFSKGLRGKSVVEESFLWVAEIFKRWIVPAINTAIREGRPIVTKSEPFKINDPVFDDD